MKNITNNKPLAFLHRCLQNLSSVVCYLSYTTMLPAEFLAAIIQCSLFSPQIVTAMVILVSFVVTLLPDQSRPRPLSNPSGHESFISRSIQMLINTYFNSNLKHFVFGFCKTTQALTVISYIRASCALKMTYKTPVAAFIIGCLSTLASFFGCEKNHPETAHVAYETIDFVFNAATSIGFLSLLNYSGPWSLFTLGSGLLALTVLSILVETDAYRAANKALQHAIQTLSPSKRPTSCDLSTPIKANKSAPKPFPYLDHLKYTPQKDCDKSKTCS